MKHLIHLVVLLVMATSTGIAHANGKEIRKCEFEVKACCVSGKARVTLADGGAIRVEVDVIWCGQPSRPGDACIIDSFRGTKTP